MSVAADLWSENQDLAERARVHPMVRGIADGTLPSEVFSSYIAQDAFFLESFARAYAICVAHSPDRESLDAFATLLAGVLDELRLHESYSADLGIDLQAVRPQGATLAYCDFLIATASRGIVAQVCAAMTPCMRLYAHLGTAIAEGSNAEYADWIDTYADPAFEELAATLERLLDNHADADDPALSDLYRRAMRLELEFFDASSPSATTDAAASRQAGSSNERRAAGTGAAGAGSPAASTGGPRPVTF